VRRWPRLASWCACVRRFHSPCLDGSPSPSDDPQPCWGYDVLKATVVIENFTIQVILGDWMPLYKQKPSKCAQPAPPTTRRRYGAGEPLMVRRVLRQSPMYRRYHAYHRITPSSCCVKRNSCHTS